MELIDEKWLGILSLILIVFCFYYTLTFFHHLKLGDERLVKQSIMGLF